MLINSFNLIDSSGRSGDTLFRPRVVFFDTLALDGLCFLALVLLPFISFGFLSLFIIEVSFAGLSVVLEVSFIQQPWW